MVQTIVRIHLALQITQIVAINPLKYAQTLMVILYGQQLLAKTAILNFVMEQLVTGILILKNAKIKVIVSFPLHLTN